MKILRWIGLIVLIFIAGYLSAFALFADGGIGGRIVVYLIIATCAAGVGYLLSPRWWLAFLCGWGAYIMVILELGATGGSTDGGGQSLGQLLGHIILALVVTLVGGYIGNQIEQRRS